MSHKPHLTLHLLIASALLGVAGLLAGPSPASAQTKAITVVLDDDPPNLDVCEMSRSYNGRIVRFNIGETLTQINRETGKLDPRLATSWERIDEKTWRFQLVRNAKFHDGSPFNADAVVKSLDRTFHNVPKLFCGNEAKAAAPSIKGKVVDEFTIDISLDRPAPVLPVTMNIIGIASPKASREKLEGVAVGTGPYKMVSRTTSEIILERNPDYWGPMPGVERARFVWRSESSVRAAMVAIGEADIASNISSQEATNPDTDFPYLNSESTRLRFEMDAPPQNDIRIRKALHYALDRNAMKGTVFSKDAVIATHIFEANIQGHNGDLKPWPYDPQKAKQLIAEAKADGVPVDREMTVICRPQQWPGSQEAMETAMGYFKAVGFNVKIRCMEPKEHTDMNTKPFDPNRGPILFQDQHDNANGDPVFSALTKYGCAGVQSTLCDKKLDALFDEAAALVSGPQRIEAWKKAFGYLYTEVVPDALFFNMTGYTRVNKRVKFKPTIETNFSIDLSKVSFN